MRLTRRARDGEPMDQIIRSSGLVVGTAPERGEEYSLPELQAIVGGYIEMVPLADGRVMVVHEEGLLQRLPHNTLATALYGAARQTQQPIVGDVLVSTRARLGYNS